MIEDPATLRHCDAVRLQGAAATTDAVAALRRTLERSDFVFLLQRTCFVDDQLFGVYVIVMVT